MDKRITVAIDGYSSTGKSTIAKQLASKLGYVYVDSGAMYRAMTLFSMQKGYISSSQFCVQDLIDNLDNASLEFIYNETLGFAEMYLNDVNVEKSIRSLEVSNLVSKVSAIPEVRKKLVAIQKEIGKNKAVVMDGRDIGSVVFTDAELKIFMTSSAETRAQRRYDELIQKGEKVSYQDVYTNVVERDRVDTSRKDSPLVKADGAIEIDNSQLSKEKQFEIILKLVEEKLRDI
ncbi:(d)CMP kinase [Flavobacteriaceae bacterium]|jgi:cytidylate kinase|nr:(d)CMP kinase [Flavobacteriaceae bacterium]MDB2490832.1 (d)CMP kinase [Flavobacteriaceae bacterium]MDB2625032.1 (d)CMP kinase [Flavobacteriaceae bacterium]MDG1981065.1 (d)CMP kinase [Flavobacteriaceae bacterium]|tara:strand:- start:7091 stop:7786 length:696 start_codon:yes stop_codon:yes gene_type:complete